MQKSGKDCLMTFSANETVAKSPQSNSPDRNASCSVCWSKSLPVLGGCGENTYRGMVSKEIISNMGTLITGMESLRNRAQGLEWGGAEREKSL